MKLTRKQKIKVAQVEINNATLVLFMQAFLLDDNSQGYDSTAFDVAVDFCESQDDNCSKCILYNKCISPINISIPMPGYTLKQIYSKLENKFTIIEKTLSDWIDK